MLFVAPPTHNQVMNVSVIEITRLQSRTKCGEKSKEEEEKLKRDREENLN